MKKLKNFFINCPLFCKIAFSITGFSIILYITASISTGFSDFFNRYISSFIRMILSHITGWIPFSLGETILVLLPVLLIIICYLCLHISKLDEKRGSLFITRLFGIVALMFSLFITSFGVAYKTSTLDVLLDLERRDVTPAELAETARIIREEEQTLLSEIHFTQDGSVMPYTLNEMNDLLNEAYSRAADKYSFIPHLTSRIKYIALSEPMTYTHISGVYAYYTGESNLNINFPDYSLPYTAAHELAHQRGFAREEEANFIAFLVCLESDDAYIKYSAYENLYEYVISALYHADAELYSTELSTLDGRIKYEISAYNEFFEKYRESAAANISGAINNTYLQSQGQTAGSESYGLVVDLAVAYYHS